MLNMKKEAYAICPNCSSKTTVKAGLKRLKNQTVQRFKCNSCSKYFSNKQMKHKSHSPKIILNSVSLYNFGYTLEETKSILAKRFKTQVPLTTIHSWLNEYKNICTFSRLRKTTASLYKPEKIIHKQTLSHVQPYTFKYNKAKLDILTKEYQQFGAIKDYINKITSDKFPHHIFTFNKNSNNKETNEQRASKLKFSHLKIEIISKNNQSNKLAKLALNLAKNNNERHTAIQDFMLINDSTTIAVEMPVYLTNWDAGYYRNQKGFIFPLSNYATPITGHIDILQIRNNLLHILDYKPNASKINPIEQLTLYALALSRKLNLPLYHFKCAWFDENNYYEFFPLHAVYKKNK